MGWGGKVVTGYDLDVESEGLRAGYDGGGVWGEGGEGAVGGGWFGCDGEDARKQVLVRVGPGVWGFVAHAVGEDCGKKV